MKDKFGTLSFYDQESMKDAMNGKQYKTILQKMDAFLGKKIEESEGLTGANHAYHDARDELVEMLIDKKLDGDVLWRISERESSERKVRNRVLTWTARAVNKDH